MRRRWGIAAAVALLLGGGGYAAVRAVPGLVRDAAQSWVHDNLPGKVLALGAIDFDLWTLTLDIRDIAIADAGAPADPLVAATAVTIDASPAALWTLSARLDRLQVTAPRVHAVIRPDGALNLAELLPESDPDSPLPEVRIASLAIESGRLRLTDQRGGAVTDTRLNPVSLALKDLSTAVDAEGQARLTAGGEDGEQLSWAGSIGLTPVASSGRFAASGLNLATLARLAAIGVTAHGRGEIAGSYTFRLPPADKGAAPAPLLSVTLERLAVSEAGVDLPDGTAASVRAASLAPTRLSLADPLVTLAALTVADAVVRLPDGLVGRVGQGVLAGLRYNRTDGAIAADPLTLERVSVSGPGRGAVPVRLARLSLASAQIAPAGHNIVLGPLTLGGLRADAMVNPTGVRVPGLWPRPAGRRAAGGGPAWAVSLAGVRVADAGARLLVQLPGARPTRMAISPLSLTIGPVASPFDRPIQLNLDARVDGRARLRLAGTASADGDADLDVTLADLPLARAAALAPPTPVQVRGGTLASQGRLRVSRGDPDFAGRLSIANLLVTERGSGDPLLGWGRLELTGLRASPDRLAIARVGFDRLQSHIIVTRDQQINLARVAGVPPADGEVDLPPDADAPAADTAAADAPVVTQVAAKAVAETTALAEATAAPPGPAAKGKVRVIAPITNTTGAAARLIPISIGTVSIRRSTIDFTDQSIEPNFQVRIDGFAGSITNLDSRPGKLARFALQGYVGDRFAPASLTGQANPFAYDRDTDLTASFRNIELPLLNPYSGRWAGYAIARGKLSTTLHWRIQNRALDAQHQIVIDQLKWGNATGSKDKVPLPVRLASSLLKDRKGVITLDLPVKGTLDNPRFRIWPIVWKIVGNVIGKVALAPFKLLGSLFGGGGADKAQYVSFATGSAVLAPDSAEALGKIAKGLADRTEVNLDIPAGPAGREDAAVLTRQALEAAVLRQKGGKPAADYAGLDPDTRRDRLKALYKARLGKGPKLPEAPDGQDKKAFEAEWLFAQLLPAFAPDDLALAALGKARADAVKVALLADGSVAPDRVFINTALAAEARDDKVQLELKIRE